MKSIDKLRYKIALALQPYYEELIKTITSESFSEKYFRVFVGELIESYGSEETIRVLTEGYNIKDTVSLDINLSNNLNELDLRLALLRAAVLYKDEKGFDLEYTRRKISENDIEELVQALSFNHPLKSSLIRNFVNHYTTTPREVYERDDLERDEMRSLLLLDEYRNKEQNKKIENVKRKKKRDKKYA